MKKQFLKGISGAIIALLATSILLGINPVRASPTDVYIINPGPDGYPAKWTASDPDVGCIGTSDFNFTGDQYNKLFFINVTVVGVSNMKGWGIGIIYDNTTLEYVSAWRPPDNVFKTAEDNGWTIISPPVTIGGGPDATHQLLVWGCTYIMGSPEWSFTGSGTLGQIQFRIIKNVNRASQKISTVITWDATWTSLYFHPSGTETPTTHDARVIVQWVEPPEHPIFYTKPAEYKAGVLLEPFDIEVWVKDVAAGWSIVAMQFALWYNTSMVLYNGYTVGTWLDGFANGGETVMYFVNDDYHGIDPALPVCYNKIMFGAIIIPGGSGWVPPYPEGEGLLVTLHFLAYPRETLFPLEPEDWTWLEIHEELVYDVLTMPVPLGQSEWCHYRAPVRVLGRNIDLYDQYPKPFGGQGPNNPSDMFAPQAEVILYAYVTYNEDPVQQKLVAFEVRHGTFYIYREDHTDENGIASVKFRIPWPCVDPVGQVFGIWDVIATVEIAEVVVNDTMQFKVWWPVEITKVTTEKEFIKTKPDTPDMWFDVEYRTYSMQLIPVIVTVTVYDELGFFIGYARFSTTVGWDEYHWCEFKYYTTHFIVHMPTNAMVGIATVYANAYDKLPFDGGVPYCPEVNTQFFIKRP